MDAQTIEKARGARILARRWFDKKNGNTYHSVRVIFANGTDYVTPFEYGYGDAYLQTAAKMLGCDLSALYWSNREMLNVQIDCTDVSRRKDLHNGGK